jgi:regulator of RNase E activity RraA
MNPRPPLHQPVPPVLTDDEFRELAALDSCSVANAIESFQVHLRNEGYTEGALTCRFPQLPPMLGYAFTLHVRSTAPPTKGRTYFENTLWWDALVRSIPAPRILVVQDMDQPPGAGALVGDLHAQILQSLGCIGVVTNGAVRDLPQVGQLHFHMYSNTLSVSHSYSHITHIGEPVRIGSLEISTGDLLHGDCHGVIRVPRELAAQLAPVARASRARDQEVVAYCRSPEFSIEGLRSLLNR